MHVIEAALFEAVIRRTQTREPFRHADAEPQAPASLDQTAGKPSRHLTGMVKLIGWLKRPKLRIAEGMN